MASSATARSDSPVRWKSSLSSTGKRSKLAAQARRNALVEDNFPWAREIAVKVASRLPTWWTPDDLIGPASIALLESAGKYDPARGIPFRAYARLAVEGACYSAARRNEYRERSHSELSEDQPEQAPRRISAEASLPPQVWQLPPDQFRVIELCYLHDLTVERAAERMRISPSKASQHHRAALENLRTLLGKAA